MTHRNRQDAAPPRLVAGRGAKNILFSGACPLCSLVSCSAGKPCKRGNAAHRRCRQGSRALDLRPAARSDLAVHATRRVRSHRSPRSRIIVRTHGLRTGPPPSAHRVPGPLGGHREPACRGNTPAGSRLYARTVHGQSPAAPFTTSGQTNDGRKDSPPPRKNSQLIQPRLRGNRQIPQKLPSSSLRAGWRAGCNRFGLPNV